LAKTIKVKDINLLLAMDRGLKKSKGSGAKFLPLLIIVAAVVVLAAAMVVLYLQNSNLKNQIEEINLYLDDETTQKSAGDSRTAQAVAIAMTSLNQSLEQGISAISSYPQITGEQIEQIYSFAGSKVKIDENFSFDSSTGMLSFGASSDTATGVPIFVAQLRASGMFAQVSYQGYQETSTSTEGPTRTDPDTGSSISTTVTTSSYRFSVTCLLIGPVPISPEAAQAEGEAADGASAEGGQ
jgi:hypothetical protein